MKAIVINGGQESPLPSGWSRRSGYAVRGLCLLRREVVARLPVGSAVLAMTGGGG